MDYLQGRRIWDLTRITERVTPRVELTDLIRFKDHWYCAFREGDLHHNHPTGRGRIIRSADGVAWASVAYVQWEGADVREPRLCITAEGLLMANTSVFFVSRQPRSDGHFYQLDSSRTPLNDLEMNVARQSVTWLSPDGTSWSEAYACPSGVNLWRWEVTWHNGMGYSVGKEGAGTLWRTRDGKTWRLLKDALSPHEKCNEASLAFGPDHTAYCLMRDARRRLPLRGDRPIIGQSDGHEVGAGQGQSILGTHVPMFGIGKPPYYQEWEWKELTVDWGAAGQFRPVDEVFRAPLGGPKLIRLKDGRWVAAARILGPDRKDGHITLFWVDPARARLTLFAEFDGSTYGGVVEHDGRLWVSYGASDVSGIYMASLDIPDREKESKQ
jgi:hypothetical protein